MCWGDSERTRFGVGRTADLGPGEEARGVPGFPRHTHLASLPCLGRVRTPPVRSRPPQASVSRPPRHSGPGSRLTAPPGWCPPREGPRVRGPRLRRREDSSVSGAEASTWQPPRPQLCAEPGLGYTRSTSSPRRPPPTLTSRRNHPRLCPGAKEVTAVSVAGTPGLSRVSGPLGPPPPASSWAWLALTEQERP